MQVFRLSEKCGKLCGVWVILLVFHIKEIICIILLFIVLVTSSRCFQVPVQLLYYLIQEHTHTDRPYFKNQYFTFYFQGQNKNALYGVLFNFGITLIYNHHHCIHIEGLLCGVSKSRLWYTYNTVILFHNGMGKCEHFL